MDIQNKAIPKQELAKPIKLVVKPIKLVEKDLYKKVMWKGKVPVYICVECDFNSNSEDEMIIHVVNHLPETEQDTAMAKLLDRR